MRTLKLRPVWISILILASSCPGISAEKDGASQIATWTAAPQIPYYKSEANPTRQDFDNVTLRQVVHVGIGGKQASVRFTNLFGTQPLEIRSAHLALRSGKADIKAGTDATLTFGAAGSPGITIDPGASVLSNPVELPTRAGSDLVISTYLPGKVAGTTEHRQGLKTYVSPPGDFTSAVHLKPAKTLKAWFFLSQVNVDRPKDARAVVAIGDSLTDFFDKLDPEKKDSRWPDILQKRLRAKFLNTSVVNQGISGSRLLYDAPEADIATRDKGLDRFERDVASVPGATDVIVLLGTNDLGRPGNFAPASEAITSRQFIDGLVAMIAKAHARGLRISGGTIPPCEGSTLGFYTAEREKIRSEINQWIRTSGKFDAVADFDRALRDPAHPTRLRPEFDSGDHTHPNDRGQKEMGDAIELPAPTKATGISAVKDIPKPARHEPAAAAR